MIALGIESDSKTQYLEISATKSENIGYPSRPQQEVGHKTSQRSQRGHHLLINVHGDFEMQSAKADASSGQG